MKTNKLSNTSRHSQEELTSLSIKASAELRNKGITLIKCPVCGTSPKFLSDNEYGFAIRCSCGAIFDGERY